MWSELFKTISAQAVAADKPDVVTIRGDARTKLLKVGGVWEKHTLPAPPRRHEVFGLADFIEAALRWSEEGNPDTDGVVFHRDNLVQLVCNDDERGDVVFLRLPFSAHWQTLQSLFRSASFDHPEFVRLLRHDLHGVVAETYLTTVRKVAFGARGGSSSDVQLGRNKGTQEFDREMVNAAAIDEIWNASASVYTIPGLDFRRSVKLTFDVDVNKQRFLLTPLPDELTIAVQDAQRDLHEQLVKALDNFTVLHGDPHVVDLSLGAIQRAEVDFNDDEE